MYNINNAVERLECINMHLGQTFSIVKLICCCFDDELEMVDYDNIMDVISEILNVQMESLSRIISDLMKMENYILDEYKRKE